MLCYTIDAMLCPQQGGTHRGKGSATIAQDEAETAAETAAETTTAPGHHHRLEPVEPVEPAAVAASLEPVEPAAVAVKRGAVGEVGADKLE